MPVVLEGKGDLDMNTNIAKSDEQSSRREVKITLSTDSKEGVAASTMAIRRKEGWRRPVWREVERSRQCAWGTSRSRGVRRLVRHKEGEFGWLSVWDSMCRGAGIGWKILLDQ